MISRHGSEMGLCYDGETRASRSPASSTGGLERWPTYEPPASSSFPGERHVPRLRDGFTRDGLVLPPRQRPPPPTACRPPQPRTRVPAGPLRLHGLRNTFCATVIGHPRHPSPTAEASPPSPNHNAPTPAKDSGRTRRARRRSAQGPSRYCSCSLLACTASPFTSR